LEETSKVLAFQGAMTIQGVGAARMRMLAALGESRVVAVDCSAVEEADISFIQMLLAARKDALLGGKTIRLVPPAAGPLREALARGGFLDPGDAAINRQFWTGET
jgi:anti-anti-sigma regulatory factor